MSKEKSKKSPIKKLLILAIVVGIAIAAKKALADKGGSYTPPNA